MICQHCRDQQHHDCQGGTHCPCQHRTDRSPAPATHKPETFGDTLRRIFAPDQPEPADQAA